jgi:hypothetical protein
MAFRTDIHKLYHMYIYICQECKLRNIRYVTDALFLESEFIGYCLLKLQQS